MSYRKHLISEGVAESRALDITVNVGSLHRTICQLDDRNLALFDMLHPGVIELLEVYAEIEGCGLRHVFRKEDELTGL